MMYVKFCLGAFSIFALSACSSQYDNPDDLQSSTIENEDPDYAIAVALYTDQRVPDQFYHNAVPEEDLFYVTYHVKNSDLVPIYDRTGMTVYELSTDDFAQALEWAETAAVYRPVYRPLVEYSETDIYFQFTRIDSANPFYIDLVRVFKRSALDRTGVDRTNSYNNYQGAINPSALSQDFCQMIVEYLWTFTFANNYGTFIIDSVITEYESEYVQTLLEAKLELYNEDTCDTIRIYELTYQILKASGEIYREDNFVREFTARRTDSGYEICNT